ncbi:unnamed protein product [Rotaria magnacalcarata]|uniref:EGF-like domain-containing protein n=1 Tax=Rotaria magnacalcarata TaxID=392030 RepID=A0A816V3Z5_9BILA|nr:unnamed protein product [Rotaria magnacalcarata]
MNKLTYMPVRDCNTKYNLYLLYPNRPKNSSINYSIRINAFHKTTLDHWASWYLPILFSFLPVNRIATQLHIHGLENIEPCSLPYGHHGRCIRYANNKSLSYCQCQQGYSGALCNIKHRCSCANDPYCLTSSICVCPLHKFGPYCHLKNSICQSNNNPCQYHGTYVFQLMIELVYIHLLVIVKKDIQVNDAKIKTAKSLLIFKDSKHEQIATFNKIPFDKNCITIDGVQRFNIIFIQVPNQDYYLTVLREIFIPSEKISTKVLPKQRCSPIAEPLNDTFLNYEYLRRAKYYPLFCRQYSQLMCFYGSKCQFST